MADSMNYNWRRSQRAKTLQVRITPWRGVEVVIPHRTSKQRVRAFLNRHRNWIRDTWQRIRSEIPDVDQTLPESLNLRAVGELWQVSYQHGTGSRIRVITGKSNSITVFRNDHDPSEIRRALRRWLATKARNVLTSRIDRLCAVMGMEYGKLQIRGQRSRWGSCSSNKTLSMNFKLLFLDPELVRYLIVHELSHLRVLDHSPRFWNIVAQHEPRWRTLDARLEDSWRSIPAWVEMP